MKNPGLKISLFFVVTFCTLILSSGLLLYKNLTGLLTAWNESDKLIVYLKVDAVESDRDQVIAVIKKHPNIESIEVVSRESSGKKFQESMKQFSQDLLTSDELMDLLPETLEVSLSRTLSIEEHDKIFSQIAEDIKTNPFVDDVSFAREGIKRFTKFDRLLRSAGAFVFILMVTVISFLLSMMFRIFIDDSKQEIEIYSLLGATRWSIYKLYIRDALRFLCTSLITSFTLLFAAFTFFQHKIRALGAFPGITDSFRFLTFAEIFSLAFWLAVFVFLGCFITIRSTVNKLNSLPND